MNIVMALLSFLCFAVPVLIYILGRKAEEGSEVIVTGGADAPTSILIVPELNVIALIVACVLAMFFLANAFILWKN